MGEDVSEHIPLINRVIGQMGLRGSDAEEAFSESLVTIVKAAQRFDPERGVPLANWLGINIRRGIQHMQAKEHVELPLDMPVETPRDVLTATVEFNEVILKASQILTEAEYQIVMAEAFGYEGKEVAKILQISEVQVSRIKVKAQRKMRESRAAR